MGQTVRQVATQEGIGSEQRECGRGAAFLLAAVVSVCVFVALPGSALAALSWAPPVRVDAGNAFGGAACPSAAVCVAVDSAGQEVTVDLASPSGATPAPIDAGVDLTGVACWSTSCAAVGENGDEIDFEPGAPGSATRGTIGTAEHVSCLVPATTPQQCTAVAGPAEVTFDPADPGSPSPTTIDSANFGDDFLSAVACPSASQCTAVDQLGDAVTFDPGSPGSATTTTIDSGVNGALGGVACPSVSQCTAVDNAGRAVTFDPASPMSPAPIVTQIDTTSDNELEGIACASVTACVADDVGGNVVEGDPLSGVAWTATPIAASTLLSGVACGSSTACVAVDAAGDVYAGTTTSTPAPPAAAPVFTADTPPSLSGAKFYGVDIGTSGADSPPAYRFVATGSPAPTYTVSSGALPTGMVLNPSTGFLTGTPTVGGQSYAFTVTASNGVGLPAVSAAITGTVGAQSACATVVPGSPAEYTSVGTRTVTNTVHGIAATAGQIDGDPVNQFGITVTTNFGPGTVDAGPNGDCPVMLAAGQEDTNVEVGYGQTIVDESPATPTSTAGTVSPASSSFGQSVTYNASVTPSPSSATDPSGTVAFTATVGSATTDLCTAWLSGGSGSCTSAVAPVGSDTITATYSGDNTFAGSSGTTTETVTSTGGSPPTGTGPPVVSGTTPVTTPVTRALAPAGIGLPVVSGTARAGTVLSCSQGSFLNTPTSFAYQWNADGTPIQGATGSTYTVQSIDEGVSLTCTVIGSNGGGSSQPVTSDGVPVPVPVVKDCPAATGTVTGTTLGLVKLGETRAAARKKYTKSSDRGKKYQDFFCLTPIGVRVGYGSSALLKTVPARQRVRLTGRVVWASTASLYYAVDGIRAGATVTAAGKTLKLTGPITIGQNVWYLAPNGASTAIFKTRHGVIEEIGIADKQLTTGHKQQVAFLKSFA
jgi:Bacterial Ig-like domain (group 3)/Putative Ig domain